MNIRIIKKGPDINDIIRLFPLSGDGCDKVARDRQEARDILSGRDNRLMVIVGPCSAWPGDAVLEYARRLKDLEEKVEDRIKLIMRAYIQKPRTAKGWVGPASQPDPFAPPDISAGARYCRKLMVDIVEMGLPIADEALFTHNAKGFLELLTWVAIGARSVEDQEHRVFASAITCPVGMKNTTLGSIEIGVNGIVAAQHPHIAMFDGYEVETFGNPHAHLVLRGGTAGGSNHSLEHLKKAAALLHQAKVVNPAVLVDASHDNCLVNGSKDPRRQETVVKDVLKCLKANPELRSVVKGFMLESFLREGQQNINSHTPETVDRGGLSITDPCMGWEQTERLIMEMAEIITV